MADRIRIMLVDDDPLVRRWLRMIIDSQSDLAVVGEAADGMSGVALAEQARPDLIVTDIQMAPMDGIETTRRLLEVQPHARVLILTTFGLDVYLYETLRAGASGFLLKTSSAEEVLQAVRCVASGDALLSPSVTRKLIDAFAAAPAWRSRRAVLPPDITDRERDVFIAVSHGLSNGEIAAELHISLATVKTHVSRLLAKVGARERAQLVIAAYESGLVVAGGDSEKSRSVGGER